MAPSLNVQPRHSFPNMLGSPGVARVKISLNQSDLSGLNNTQNSPMRRISHGLMDTQKLTQGGNFDELKQMKMNLNRTAVHGGSRDSRLGYES